MKVFAGRLWISRRARTMKNTPRLSIVTCLAYCIDKELDKAIGYLRKPLQLETGNGLSATRDLWTATELSWAEGAGTMERDSIAEGLSTLS